jgi:tubulin epsilon
MHVIVLHRAVGYYEYGNKYSSQILELIRRAVERTDSLEAFILIHSLGGGTGSGLGSRALMELADEYPNVLSPPPLFSFFFLSFSLL